jgi:hypothetical protein
MSEPAEKPKLAAEDRVRIGCFVGALVLVSLALLTVVYKRYLPVWRVEGWGGEFRVLDDGTPFALNLSNRPIDDRALEYLLRFRRLEVLNLSNTRVTDEGLALLHEFPELLEVDLSGTTVTDAGLARLLEIKTLRAVRVNHCPGLSAAGALQLKTLPALMSLAVRGVPLSPEQYRELSAGLDPVLFDADAACLQPTTAYLSAGWHHLDGPPQIGLAVKPGAPPGTLASVRYPAQVVSIRCGDPDRPLVTCLHPDDYPELTRFPNLRSLSIEHGVGDAELAAIGQVSSLEYLWLRQGEFTDEGISNLAGLKALDNAYLYSPHVKGTTLRALSGLPLTKLILEFPNCDTRAFSDLSGLKSMHHLRIWRSGLTDEDLQFARDLPELYILELDGNPLTARAVPQLMAVPSLMEVSLYKTQITDADLQPLIELFKQRRLVSRPTGPPPAP